VEVGVVGVVLTVKVEVLRFFDVHLHGNGSRVTTALIDAVASFVDSTGNFLSGDDVNEGVVDGTFAATTASQTAASFNVTVINLNVIDVLSRKKSPGVQVVLAASPAFDSLVPLDFQNSFSVERIGNFDVEQVVRAEVAQPPFRWEDNGFTNGLVIFQVSTKDIGWDVR